MCGICGVRRFGDEPISKDTIDMLLINNANRGLEATGVAIQQANGSVVVHKQDLTPLEFLGSADYEKFMHENLKPDSLTVLGHTRKATIGSPKINNNNHPMFAGTTALVHNGHISDHEHWFKELKLERNAETDSDILRAILDKEGFTRKAIDKLARLNGNAAFAAISPKYPGKLLLGRSGNPIELMATPNFLFFSSERGPLYKALRPYRRVFGIVMRDMNPINYYMNGMTDNSAWLFTNKPKEGQDWAGDWVEWHQEMTITRNFVPVDYTKCHAQYHGTREKYYDEKPADVVLCSKCNLWVPVPQLYMADLSKVKCGRCKTVLG